MLKNIGNLFEKKKIYLGKSRDKSFLVKEAIQAFLKNKFGELLAGFSVGVIYDSKNNILTINSGNKVLANELAMCSEELNDFLKNKHIRLERIVIR